MTFDISYIIATRNRLPLLKITLQKLMDELQPNEEIVVVDGNSTDGAKEYLQQLFDDRKIHQFISEPDRNQAHGWNKAILMAKGTLIKKIIDDDVFDFSAIRQCKQFMLDHPNVDVCISNCINVDSGPGNKVDLISRLKEFEQWKSGATSCFTFNDVYMLIRKSAISYAGLYDTQFTMMDWEYSLRLSWLKLNIVYYTGCNALPVATPGNVTSTASNAVLKREEEIGMCKYGYRGDRADISLWSKVKIGIGKAIYKTNQEADARFDSEDSLGELYITLYQTLQDYNNTHPGNFIGLE
ncbi:MAG TPA: glycosyltransferase [Mucilaginibacter sp.]|nr:glycosyltransferase [Mucilaginibacter sp.]